MLIKFRIPDVFFGAMVAVAIFAMGMIFGSSSHQPTNQPSQATTQQVQTSHNPTPFTWDWFTHDGVVFFTAALCFIAGVQAFLFVWQLRSIQRTIKPAEDAAKAAAMQSEAIIRAERAYVTMSHNAPGIFISEDRRVEISVDVKNFGRTPARITDVLLSTMIIERNQTLPSRPIYTLPANKVLPTAFLVAGDNFNAAAPLLILAETQFNNIKTGELQLFVVGYVDYIDQFQGRHRSGYGRRYVPDATGNNLVFIDARGYNYDCLRPPGEGKDWNENSQE